MTEKFDRHAQFAEALGPKNWLYMASVLQKAADGMDWTKKRDITDWRYIPVFRMLMGFAIENLIKGILIAEGSEPVIRNRRLNPDFARHGLRDYARKIKGLRLSRIELRVLADLEPYVLWAGRYPIPTTPRRWIRMSHSKQLRDAEAALGQKLATYLQRPSPGT